MENYEFSIFCLGLLIAGMVLTEIFHQAKHFLDKAEEKDKDVLPRSLPEQSRLKKNPPTRPIRNPTAEARPQSLPHTALS